MKVRFDFSIDAWIKDLEIEANSEEEALNKLYSMSLKDIVEEYHTEKAIDFINVESEVLDATYEVRISNVSYIPGSLDDEEEFSIVEVEAQYPDGTVIEIESTEEPDIFKISDYLVDNSKLTLFGEFNCDYEILNVR